MITNPSKRRAGDRSTRVSLRGPEVLESRRMAAVLIYDDVDGDTVQVSCTKVTNTELRDAIQFHSAGVGKEIVQINMESMHQFQGAKLSISVTDGKGNGRADVGVVNARGIDLESLYISGNLTSIWAGDVYGAAPGVGVLKVGSFSVRDWGQGKPDPSEILGGVKTFQVSHFVSDDAIFLNGHVGEILVYGSIRNADITAMAIDKVFVGGNVEYIGSSGFAGRIYSFGGVGGGIGSVTVSGNLVGASIESAGHIGTVKVLGSVIGGWGPDTGSIQAGDGIDSVYVKYDVYGWTGYRSGSIRCVGDLGKVWISGSLRGSNGEQSGSVFASHKIGSVRVKHDIVGGGGLESGTIQSQTSINNLWVEGGLFGGSGPKSGRIESFVATKHVVIEEGIKGGAGDDSGVLASFGNIISCYVHGDVQGGGGMGSGRINAGGNVSNNSPNATYALFIHGSVIGGAGDQSGSINAQSIVGRAYIFKSLVGGGGRSSGSIRTSKSIGNLIVNGSLVSGIQQDTGSIRAGDSINSLFVSGNIVGNPWQPVLITAAGIVNPDAITTITVKHSVAHALILAGYDNTVIPVAVSGAARMGTVSVSGNLVASSIVAGAEVPAFLGNGGPSMGFGTVWDAPIGNVKASIIAKVIVGGGVFGTAAAGDHYGIVGGWIGVISVHGKKISIPQPGDLTPLGGQGDCTLHVLS